MRGRKPKPTVIHVLEGGKEKTRRNLNDREPKPKPNIPKCPPHLDKEARAEWNRMAKELEPIGLLTNIDKAIFAVYCQAFSTWAQACKMIQEKGMVHLSPIGYPIQNPYFPIANKAKEHMMKALAELGMTPSSRSRIKADVPNNETRNEKERFFR